MEIVQDDNNIGLKLALPQRPVFTTFQVKIHIKKKKHPNIFLIFITSKQFLHYKTKQRSFLFLTLLFFIILNCWHIIFVTNNNLWCQRWQTYIKKKKLKSFFKWNQTQEVMVNDTMIFYHIAIIKQNRYNVTAITNLIPRSFA